MCRPVPMSLFVLAASLMAIGPVRADDIPRPSQPLTPGVFAIGAAPVFATAAVASEAEAQSASSSGGSGGSVGIKGGWLYSNFEAARADFTHRDGFIVGIFFGSSRPGVSVATEILYAKKGAKIAGQATDLHYLEVPVLLRIKVGDDRFGVYGIGGPAFDVKLGDNQTGNILKVDYESVDIGLIAGAGIEISRFLVEGRYNWGLRNILKAGGGLTDIDEIKTRTFALMAGLRF